MTKDIELTIISQSVKAKIHKLGFYPYTAKKIGKFLPRCLYKKLVRWERIIRWKLRRPLKFIPLKYSCKVPEVIHNISPKEIEQILIEDLK